MPPLPPMQPLPPPVTAFYDAEPGSELQDSQSPTNSSPTDQPAHRPSSLSFSSSMSSAMNRTTSSKESTISSRPRTTSAPLSYNAENAFPFFENLPLTGTPLTDDGTTQPREFFIIDKSTTEYDAGSPPQVLFPLDRLESLSERSLSMHLYRSYQSVLACEEAMWEELQDRLLNRKDELLPFGWDNDEDLEELESRKKFERLVDRYRSYVYIMRGDRSQCTNVHPQRHESSCITLVFA